MDEAFLELLEKKDFDYITVKEICTKAGVNRSTFYLHYETVADLLEECTKYIINQFVDYMKHDSAEFIEKLSTRPLEELYLITPEYLTPYLNYIKSHRRIFLTSIEQASTLKMDEAYFAMNRHIFEPILTRFHVPKADQSYMMAFYINGIMAVISEWLKNDCSDSIEHIVSVICRIIPSINNYKEPEKS